MKMNIRRNLLALAVVLGGMGLGAAESVWIGGASGSFGTAENWDPVGVPNVKDSIAVFTNAATVKMSGSFCEIHARGGDLTINHTYRVEVVGNSNNEVVVDVGDGYTVTFTIANANLFYGGTKLTFVKSGAGRLNVPRCLGYKTSNSDDRRFKDVDIRGGTLYLSENYGGLNTVDGYVHIADGAKFLQGSYCEIPNNVSVELDAGGTLDFNNVGNTTLRGIFGGGTVSKLGLSSAPVTLRCEAKAKGSQGVFSGTMASGSVKLAPTNGCPLIIRSVGPTYADVQTWDAYIQNAGTGDGGFEKDGCGCLRFGNYVLSSGPIVMRAGKIASEANSPWILGSGSLQIDRGLISIEKKRTDFQIVADAGTKLTVNGPSAIRLDDNEMRLQVGASDASSTPFAFGPNGMLAFCLPACTTLANGNVTVHGGLPAGLPVFAYYQYAGGATSSRKSGYNLIPVETDADNHLAMSGSDYTNAFPTAGSDAVVRKGNSEILAVPANVAPIAALHVYGGSHISGEGEVIRQRKIGGVNIPAGVTLPVGNGTSGLVLLNNYYFLDDYGWARVQGPGTLDFGTSKGVVVASDCYESYNKTPAVPYPAQLNCRLAGTAGVTFASPLTVDPSMTNTYPKTAAWSSLNGYYMRAVEVGGDNAYSGGTRIDGMVVQPLRATSLGTGVVTVVGDTNGGGELNFTSNYVGTVFGNALTLSGTGYPSTASAAIWGKRAAVSSYNKALRLTGAVELAGDATIVTSGEKGKIVLEGPVTGPGTLRLTAGKLVVRKQAIAAYKAGKIVADPGAEIEVRLTPGLLTVLW